MTRGAGFALVLLLVAALAGPAAAADAPIQRHTADDMALARRALIKKAEVGKGWTAVRPVSGRSTLTCKASHPSMAGIVETGTAATGFRGGPQVIGQVVWVYRTATQAATLWKRAAGKSFLRCLVDAAKTAGGLPVTKIRSGELAVPKLTGRTVAYRVIASATVRGKPIELTYDNFLLAQGRTVTQITFGAAGPIPSAVELALAQAVAKRLGTTGAA